MQKFKAASKAAGTTSHPTLTFLSPNAHQTPSLHEQRAGRSEWEGKLTYCSTSAATQAQTYQAAKGRRILPQIALSGAGVSRAPRTSREK